MNWLIILDAGKMTKIFESPDKGNTVFVREAGELERACIKRDPLDHRNFHSTPEESQLWHDIRIAARTDKSLQDALDRVKIIYYLSKKEEDGTSNRNTLNW